MSLQILPVTSDPNQSFKTTLTINGENRTLQFNIRFNEIAGYWVVTISDPETGSCIIDSIPVLQGPDNDTDLLSQHHYLGIGSMYVVNISGTNTELTDKNLGTDYIIAWR